MGYRGLKRVIAMTLAAAMVLGVGWVPLDDGAVFGVAAADTVSITVRDITGEKGSISNSAAFTNDMLSPAVELKGETYADISYKGTGANKLWYQFVKSPVASGSAMPSNNWVEIPLTGVTNNPDVMTDRPGNLKRRSYDVTMLPNVTDTATWNNRDTVFKYPFEATEVVSAATNTNLSTYGTYISYLNYQNQNKRRFNASTVFSALNGTGDMYPPDDYFYRNGTPYKINFSGETPYITVDNTNINLNLSGHQYYFVESYRNWWGGWSNRNVFTDSNSPSAKYQEASKMWGYFKVPKTGDYYFGMYSDDGATGSITVNGVTSKFYNSFKVQGTTWGTDNKKYTLDKDKYYPVNLEYFNWGGGAQYRMVFKGPDNSSWTNVNPSWFYPSVSNAPGEFANTTFTGAQGVKMPTATGDYYILYKATAANGNTVVSGCYGPFTIPGTAEMTLSKKALYADGTPVTAVQAGVPFEIRYTVKPADIVPNALLGSATSIYVTGGRIQDNLTAPFIVTSPEVAGSFIFPNAATDANQYTFVLPSIKYNLTTLPDGSRVYRPEQAEYIYKVNVKLSTASASKTQISEDGLSVMTYNDPSNGGLISKAFENGEITKESYILTPAMLTDSKGELALDAVGRYHFNARLTFTLNRKTRGTVEFDFDGSKVPMSAIKAMTLSKAGQVLTVVPTLKPIEGTSNYQVVIPMTNDTGVDDGDYKVTFTVDGAPMMVLGTVPFSYVWTMTGFHVYDYYDENRTTNLGTGSASITINVRKAPRIE